jgi:hypothetical protein
MTPRSIKEKRTLPCFTVPFCDDLDVSIFLDFSREILKQVQDDTWPPPLVTLNLVQGLKKPAKNSETNSA